MAGALAPVTCILRRQANADALQDLGPVISDFLGPDPSLSIAEACSFNSLPLLDWIWRVSSESKANRTSRWTLTNYLRSDPKYYQWQFQKAAIAAATAQNLYVLKWLFTHFSGCWAPVMVPEAAAKNGDVKMLEFLLNHDEGRKFKSEKVLITVGMKRMQINPSSSLNIVLSHGKGDASSALMHHIARSFPAFQQLWMRLKRRHFLQW